MTHSLAYETADAFAAAEIGPCEQWLNTHISPDDQRTFAHPYGRLILDNGAPYTELLPRKFIAAREGNGGPVTAAAAKAAPFNIPASATTWAHDSADTSIAHMEAALGIDNGWSVLLFHDVYVVGKPWEGDTNRSVHREILRYASGSPKFWVAPFRDVYRYILDRA